MSQSVVCLICRYKIFKKGRVLNNGTKLIDLIREKYSLLSKYDPADMTLPNALCSSCCSDIYNSENSKQSNKLPLIKACAYISTNAEPEAMHTRACSAASACYICQSHFPWVQRTACTGYRRLRKKQPSVRCCQQTGTPPLPPISKLLSLRGHAPAKMAVFFADRSTPSPGSCNIEIRGWRGGSEALLFRMAVFFADTGLAFWRNGTPG